MLKKTINKSLLEFKLKEVLYGNKDLSSDGFILSLIKNSIKPEEKRKSEKNAQR